MVTVFDTKDICVLQYKTKIIKKIEVEKYVYIFKALFGLWILHYYSRRIACQNGLTYLYIWMKIQHKYPTSVLNKVVSKKNKRMFWNNEICKFSSSMNNYTFLWWNLLLLDHQPTNYYN